MTRTEKLAYLKEYRAKNVEKRRAYQRAWYEENREQVCADSRAYYQDNKPAIRVTRRKYQGEREKVDMAFRLGRRLRSRLYHALTGKNKAVSAVNDMGCTLPELRAHLEQQFQSGMTWDNYGAVWEVDHIKPLANYDLTDRDTCLQLIHYSNLQPLFVADNRSKCNKESIQPSLFHKTLG